MPWALLILDGCCLYDYCVMTLGNFCLDFDAIFWFPFFFCPPPFLLAQINEAIGLCIYECSKVGRYIHYHRKYIDPGLFIRKSKNICDFLRQQRNGNVFIHIYECVIIIIIYIYRWLLSKWVYILLFIFEPILPRLQINPYMV